MHWFAFIPLLQIFGLAQPVLSATIITSDPVTDWGEWGYPEKCPEGQYAKAFQLKTQPDQGHFRDDTSLNAIILYCGDLNSTGHGVSISSSRGRYGQWGKIHSCLGGFISGFQLRVEGDQYSGDDTATNNFRAFCSHSGEYVEGDGLNYGNWGNVVHCPMGQFICALQTQLDAVDCRAIGDCTGINNVMMACCDF